MQAGAAALTTQSKTLKSNQNQALSALGWGEFFSSQPMEAFDHMEGMLTARIAREDRQAYDLLGDFPSPLRASLGGGLRYKAASREDLPAVGDWVLAHHDGCGEARVMAVYARRSMLARQMAGERTGVQIIAANVDTIFIVTSMNQEFQERRLERYLFAVRESGAQPVLVLNKRDLAPDPASFVARAHAIASGAPVVALSALARADMLSPWLGSGETVALVGSSGVGKSTLINMLMRDEVMPTGSIRQDDDEGRHTTTARHLMSLPHDGGVLIDTPGMRELQLWTGSQEVEALFADIVELAQGCRFRDCAHDDEPGCAVREAAERGELTSGRLGSYQKLLREVEWQARRQDVALERAEYRRVGKMTRSASKKLR